MKLTVKLHQSSNSLTMNESKNQTYSLSAETNLLKGNRSCRRDSKT